MALTIYGTAASRAARPLWVAAELGLQFTHVPLAFLGGATRTPEFLQLNPNGRIPVVDDSGVVVWESMACSLYLAERFAAADGISLAAKTPAEQAAILRWTFWVVTECEKDSLAFLMHRLLMPPERRKPHLADEALGRLAGPLRVLEQELQGCRYLAGERFTVADICVASVLAWTVQAVPLMQASPHVQEWLQRCLARPAYRAVQALAASC